MSSLFFTSTIIVQVEDMVMSWAEIILGRDDPIYSAHFFFARETSFRRCKILHIL